MRNDIKIKKVCEHYEVRVGGQFYCSCDTIGEVLDEVFELENKEETENEKVYGSI